MRGDGTVTAPVLEVAGLHVHYGRSHILRGIDLSVRAGESVALLGRNGMGKTTTLRAIMGLAPATGGTIRVLGSPTAGMVTHQIARAGVALVPEGRGVFPTLTVVENLIMASRPPAPGIGGEGWTLDRVLTLFPRLAERLANRGNQLSGGEQQMLAIGRALLTNPQLLLLDEATEGLAPAIRGEIWTVIRQIRAGGMATIVVDKDLSALLALCERCVILVKGEVVWAGASADLEARPDIHVRHLGV